jgi:hypothetical protein
MSQWLRGELGFCRRYRGERSPGRSKEEVQATAFLLEKGEELSLMTTGL